jgi:hypothetical protein
MENRANRMDFTSRGFTELIALTAAYAYRIATTIHPCAETKGRRAL